MRTVATIGRESRIQLQRNGMEIPVQKSDFHGRQEEIENDSSKEAKDEKRLPKPPFSYISLIVMAIIESPYRQRTLRGIINYIQTRFAYYGEDCPIKGWKNSIRHNLSLNDCFEKTFRDSASSSKGHYWRLHPDSVGMFHGGSFKRRKTRFKKRITDVKQENNTNDHLLPSDVIKHVHDTRTVASHSDVAMTSLQFVNPTSYHGDRDISTQDILPFSPRKLSQGHLCHGSTMSAENFGGAAYKEHTSSISPPTSYTSTVCFICAGCTCFNH